MTKTTLGRLKKVDLRTAWANESSHFTPWLAQDENIVLLGETIGLELEIEGQEERVGPFYADILCRDTATDTWVLIENQLEKTDHCHLGQLLTYAAGLDAVTIVWIAQRFTEEHRAALDWLNEKTEEGINFFGLEIELWRIDDSPMAPKFNIVSKPNDWSRIIKDAAGGSRISDKQKLRLEFWTGFNNLLSESRSVLKARTPNPSTWLGYSLGTSGFRLAAEFTFWNSQTDSYDLGEIKATFIIASKAYSKNYYDQLYAQKEKIEEQLGFGLEWLEKDGQIARYALIRNSVDVNDKNRWSEYYQWLKDHLETMHKVFSPIVKNLNRSEYRTS